jgi:hypothetical protein
MLNILFRFIVAMDLDQLRQNLTFYAHQLFCQINNSISILDSDDPAHLGRPAKTGNTLDCTHRAGSAD